MDSLTENNNNIENIVIGKINEEFGGDLLKLTECSELKKKLEADKERIENFISPKDTGVPSKIFSAIQHVQESLEKIKKLSDQHETLVKSVDIYEEKVNKVKALAADYIDKINTLEKAHDYLEVIREIEEISNSLETSINDKNEKKQITHFQKLSDIYKSLANTKCFHLLSYARETLHYWHNILKEKFVEEFEETLKVLKWPCTVNVLTNVPSVETINRFQLLSEYFMQIQLDDKESVPSALPTEFRPLSLLMTQLIKPLKKRFIYHFMGTKQTNRADKPEWYFTQILTWIREHQEFVEKNVQPVYDKFAGKNASAKIEFMRGLVQIAVEKLHYELPQLCYDDSLFSHCIDEALGFDKDLKNSFGYPDTEPGVIEVLTQAQILTKWINMEKHFTLEKMDTFLTSPTAFSPITTSDVDELQITECGSSFITLLSTLSERYEMLIQPGHKLQFLQLQLDLIDDFRIRLLQKLGEESGDLLSNKFPNILNTINYLRDVLDEWGVSTRFLHLQYYKSKLDGKNDATGTVFDEYVVILSKLRDDLLEELTDSVFMDVKAKSMPYRKDKWHAMDSTKNFVKPNLTATACPMFQVLITKLHQMQEVLATPLFKQCWHSLANKTDQYLYEEIILICVFNEGGGLQFSYDIVNNLFPLFGQYFKKPEAQFKLLKDSAVLLSMSKGLALSLIEALKEKEEDSYEASAVLADVGIYNLDKADVLSILSRRTDLE